jgi:hypothetical protein
LIWAYYWCTTTTDILEQNFSQIDVTFTLNGEEVPVDQFAVTELEAGGNQCRILYTALSNWQPGEHQLETAATFKSAINDGMASYPEGDYVSQYNVYVAP